MGRVSVVMQIYTQIYKLLLLFIENILGVLIGKELRVKSSYPLGSCPNLGLIINIRHYESFRRMSKTNLRHYDSFCRILTDLVI